MQQDCLSMVLLGRYSAEEKRGVLVGVFWDTKICFGFVWFSWGETVERGVRGDGRGKRCKK